MPAPPKAYSADAATSARTLKQREEDAIAVFLEKTDHLLAAVVVALLVCLSAIGLST